MIKHLRVTVDGHSYYVTVELADEPGAPQPAAATPNPAPATPPAPPQVAVAAPKPAAAPAPPVAAAPAAPAGAGDVPSPLAGWVVGVDVTVGQEVQSGDKLLTLEAMKMNTSVMAPISGKISEVLAAVGGAVEQGQILVRIR